MVNKELRPGNEKTEPSQRTIDFFISRAGAQTDFAQWIAAALEEQGYSTFLQDWDFHDQNFLERMHDALKRCLRIIILLSPEYLASPYCTAEWTNAMAGDPLNRSGRLIFLRVVECAPDGMLRAMYYLDLVGLLRDGHQHDLRDVLLSAVRNDPRSGKPIDRYLHQPTPILHRRVRPQPNFAGRRDDLQALHQALSQPPSEHEKRPLARAAIHGLPGVGKSVLALQYAWENQERYSGIWWISASSVEDLSRDLVTLGSMFIPGLKDMQNRELAIRTTLDLITSGGFEQPWLLIYDDVEAPKDLKEFLPLSGPKVIITSRWADWTGEAVSFPLGVLAPSEAIEFLLARTERYDRTGAQQLAHAVGYLPLALGHAAAYCRHVGESFVSYARRLPELIRRAPRGTDYERTVFATFTTACEAACALCKDATIVLDLIAFLGPEDIPVDLISSNFLARASRDDAIEALAILSLIFVRSEQNNATFIDVHRLVQAVVRLKLELFENTDKVIDSFGLLAPYLPDEIWETEKAAQAVFTAGEMVLQTHFSEPGSSQAQPAEQLKYFLTFMRARRVDGSPEDRDAYERLLGKIFAYGAVAHEYGVEIDQADAEAWRRWDQLLPHIWALISCTINLPGKEYLTSRLLGALATILYSQGRQYAVIEHLLSEAVSVAEALPQSKSSILTTALRNLAFFLRECKRDEEAEPLLTRALSVDLEIFGHEHPNFLRDAIRLAALLFHLMRPEEARRITNPLFESGKVKEVFGESESWPRDIERAFGEILMFELTNAMEKETAVIKARNLAWDERRRLEILNIRLVRQKLKGYIFYLASVFIATMSSLDLIGHYVDLHGPIRQTVNLYQATIIEPLTFMTRVLISKWRVASISWDILVIWIAFWVAANGSLIAVENNGVFKKLKIMTADFGIAGWKKYGIIVLGAAGMFIGGLPMAIYFFIRGGFKIEAESRGILIVFVIASCLVTLMVSLSVFIRN